MRIDDGRLAAPVAKAITKRRLACGLTQEQVAERLEIGTEAVSRMERGAVLPSLLRLLELADIYDCQVAELLLEVSPRPGDQAEMLTKMLDRLSDSDRALVMGVVEQLVDRLA